MLLSLGQACGTEFSSCREGEPCSGVATAAGGSGGTGGSVATGAGGDTGGNAAGGGGDTSTTVSSGGVAGEAGALGEAGAPSTSSSGGTSGIVPVPCDGTCEGATPECDETSDTCVECLDSNSHCEAPTPACDPGAHECVECVENGDCAEGVCDPATHQCVECLENENCDETSPFCDPDHFCAECLKTTDCTDPQASLCDAGSCSPCQSNADCAHLVGTTVCDTAAGECVECTIEEEAVCGGTSCNPATRACTTTELGSRDDCEPGAADSECVGNDASEPVRRCMPMEFAGELREQAYCLKRQVAGCERPYAVPVVAISISGAAEETYCGIDEQNVTCEAVRDLFQSRSCTGGEDTECGCPRDEDGICTSAGEGGVCRHVGTFDNRCTYQCGNLDQCVTGLICANQDPDFCQ